MHHTLVATALALATAQPLAAALSTQALPPNGAAQVSQVTAAGETVTSLSMPIASVSQQSLAQGREVYTDLQRALRAADRHDDIDTRLALDDASRVLDTFYEPAATRALRGQAAIVRQDLENERAKPEAGLWLPLEAELDAALVTAPAEHRAAARKAVEEGREAAAKGDRKTARARLDVLEAVLDYRWSLLPLHKIRGDVHSAEMAMSPSPPYWAGVVEAMRSALHAVRWVASDRAAGWFSAYDAAVDARYRLPGDPARARADLDRVAKDLSGLPRAAPLARDAQKLAGETQPKLGSVESLVRGLRAAIPVAGEG